MEVKMVEKVTTEDRGAVRILRINRPEQRNCVDGETAVLLGRAIDAFAAGASARRLGVTGAAAPSTVYPASLPPAGYRGCQAGPYARKHAPWVNFSSVSARENQPFSAF